MWAWVAGARSGAGCGLQRRAHSSIRAAREPGRAFSARRRDRRIRARRRAAHERRARPADRRHQPRRRAGIIGTDSVVRAAPDGYTLVWGTSSGLAILPALKQKLPFDPQRDLAPISLGAKLAYVLVVHPSLPANTVKQLIALAKARPGQLNFASAGHRRRAASLGRALQVDGRHRHRARALSRHGAVRDRSRRGAGRARFREPRHDAAVHEQRTAAALAVTTAHRVDAYPDLPTMAEAGLAGLRAHAVVCAARACENAARHDRGAERRDPQSARRRRK